MQILIVEDDERIARTLKKNFIKEGHNADISSNGEDALNTLKDMKYDIILLDWRLPKLSGLDLCRKIRESKNQTPVILLTALNDIANKVEALDAGADDYITKPFSFEEVSARINFVLRRYRATIKKISFSEYELNLIDRTIEMEDKNIKLTEREFELLKYFLFNKGVIINKEKICRDVWNLNFSPMTNIIEVTIKNLRKKLEYETNKSFIKTIYGEGYLFIAD
ncbi:MAG: response regulator transcription factor [Melioribacteraceae bacterium]|nr:response regulator transcription factor [Melioribacteraceae bacterium]